MFFAKILMMVVIIVTAIANEEHSSFQNEADSVLIKKVRELIHLFNEVQNHLNPSNNIYSLVNYVMENYLQACNIVYVYGGGSQNKITSFLRMLNKYRSHEILETDAFFTDHSDLKLSQFRKAEERETCRVVVFDLTESKSPSSVLNFMEKLELYLIRHTSVLFLGSKSYLQPILGDSALMNTVNVLYLVVESLEGENFESTPSNRSRKQASPPVAIYSRCLFCNESGPGIEFISFWNNNLGLLRHVPLFKDQFRNFQGYVMRIVQMEWFPLVGYRKEKGETSNLVTPIDSVHVRMLNAIATTLNFTYEMRMPHDKQWGLSTESGNWTGMIGTMQHHMADFGLSVTYNLHRIKVVDYTRIVLKETMFLITSRSRPSPQYLAIIHPLTVELWIILAVLSVSSGLVLWGLQIAFKNISGRPGMSYDVSSLYTWSVLFEEPATKLPSNASSLIFFGSWCIFCLFITSMYKSSLIAHLSIPGTPDSIDSYQEMLEDGGWTWGFGYNHSNAYYRLKTDTNPVIKQIFKGLMIKPNDEQVEMVLNEKHALIAKEFIFKSLKSTISKIRRGVDPFHYADTDQLDNGDGWAFRQNAPFFDAIDMRLQRLIETGHINRWLKELVGIPREEEEEACDDAQCNMDMESEALEELPRETSGQVVLNLNHLQSAFYLLVIGLAISSLAFAGENACRKEQYVAD